ncbi:hypothetical protein [Actinophytocola sp.]|uniref:hypothetical protein n=1 Tax=Actinophytocola sp. TaxID=1872138 RepID=UPI00389ABBE6
MTRRRWPGAFGSGARGRPRVTEACTRADRTTISTVGLTIELGVIQSRAGATPGGERPQLRENNADPSESH